MEQAGRFASSEEPSLSQKSPIKITARQVPGQAFKLSTALGIGAAIGALYFGREVLEPIALALLLSFLLAPLMVRFQRVGLGKTWSAITVVLLSFIAAALIGWVVIGQLYGLATELPQYRENVRDKLRTLNPAGLGRLGKAREMIGEVTGVIAGQNTKPATGLKSKQKPEPTSQQPIPVQVREPEPSPFQLLKNAAGSVFEPLATAFIVIIFVVFMLLNREDLRDRVLRLAGSGRLYLTTQVLDDAARRVSRYLLMQLAVNSLYGALVGTGLLLIGVPHALVWAVLAMLLRFVPYIGAWIAAAGPLLLAVAVDPGWSKFAWTFGLYVVLEFLAANVAEPLLYGSSTGISSLAILVAATFWTWLWGPVGLLLSTPLTVCLVVMGRYIPHLEFLGILFGDEPVLSASQRFYQRMIAMDAEDAAELAEELLGKGSLAEVYDQVMLPAITLVEEGRHAGFLDSAIEQYALENTRELVEDLGARQDPGKQAPGSKFKVLCLPARDAADAIAAEMLAQLMPANVVTQVMPLENSTHNHSREGFEEAIAAAQPDLICISGVPPQATRQVALRCKHLRRRFPELPIMAAVWSNAELATLRSRIPVRDANHVVCTLPQALEYVKATSDPTHGSRADHDSVEIEQERTADLDIAHEAAIPLQEALDKITQGAAKKLDAPIAILRMSDESGHTWESHCGLAADLDANLDEWSMQMENGIGSSGTAVAIEDIEQNDRLAQQPFLREQGIHFYANAWLVGRSGDPIGWLRILDTRPRQMNQGEKDLLTAAATSAVEAMEVRTVAPSPEQAHPEGAEVPASQQGNQPKAPSAENVANEVI